MQDAYQGRVVSAADVADEDDEHGDEGEAKEHEGGEDEIGHGSVSYGLTGDETRDKGRAPARRCGETAGTTGVAAASWW